MDSNLIVLTDQDGRVSRRALPAKDAPDSLAQAKHEVGRDGSLTDSTSHAVRSEITT